MYHSSPWGNRGSVGIIYHSIDLAGVALNHGQPSKRFETLVVVFYNVNKITESLVDSV